uniref:Uncharacterized protein n=1 Tax=Timema poppense TaxID=170557 RepID=A0A7R9DMH5_TIMPO|nr:unnamed protein product [Timema poppensis]
MTTSVARLNQQTAIVIDDVELGLDSEEQATHVPRQSSEVAKNIHEDSYGLIFGANTLFSLVLQTVLTLIVMSGNGLALASRQQYYVYGGYFGVLGVVFGVKAAYSFFKNKNTNS